MERNVICVKWGKKYASEEVNSLFKAVDRNTSSDVRFFCLTDDADGLAEWIEPVPLEADELQTKIADAQTGLRRHGALRKVAVFRPDLITDLNGPLLCLDIDILITSSLDEIFRFSPGKVCMAPPFRKRSNIETKGEGSVIRFDPRQHTFLYENILSDTETALKFSMGSEQRYTSFTAFSHGALENFPSDWIVSYTRSCRPPKPLNLFLSPTLPRGAKVVCFPSEPKAQEAMKGYKAGINSSRPAPWIADYL